MPKVFLHGLPETSLIWRPLIDLVEDEVVAPNLPGFASSPPNGFSGTKDALVSWLAHVLAELSPPVDVVAHDLGALLTLRVVTAFPDVAVRSYVVDVANIFHPRYEWPSRVKLLQRPGVGEDMLRRTRDAAPEDASSARSRLLASGVPAGLASLLAEAYDARMSRAILDFYRSAVPNLAKSWWEAVGPTNARGLVLLLDDPPEDEAMSIEVAAAIGAATTRLPGLNHCWMAEAPAVAAHVLREFWRVLDDPPRH